MISHNPEQTQEIGKKLSQLAAPGDIILLTGNLGAGKTCLTQGIIWGLDIDEYAASPTFTIMREYQGRLPLYHFDFYRLDSINDIYDLGMDDYLFGKGLCVIEWAEKGLDIMPEDHLLIEIEYVSENERRLELKAHGQRYDKMLNDLKV
ncbi:MAG: tRNA (adenosine(37)-N6)-threonylcarbamoyltransferase complex ATPase subunit type 1 TsaE [Chloroflexi bacterium]|nr:tRNA (adenosine(37)-N6)-threonylcarbamoyltransferase complex ATPase subunit type 1 TsaE [Chloroflexota bacterium]MBT7082132.1 tRNA (adenosine(37)-N6)-threonylcarbamoyltransferase complex ATPase subunit type 1 TsaE [Chloroflexota bacterium]MBT7290004.1 tRNA (adenosine(37)-N6)-threonylcarbamoyltransferase complex ATPase subunit type 1 TsaE [Chloroflexota bacterium]